MPEFRESKKEFSTSLINLTDSSRMQWIKVPDNKSLGTLMRFFVKRRWFFVYKQRYDEHFMIFSSGVDLEKDLRAKVPKANWEVA